MKKVLLLVLLFPAFHAYAQENTVMHAQAGASLKTLPVLWQQYAAEYRALCYQAFNIAGLRLNEISKRQFRKHKMAIITDLDETILDNSYSEAQQIKEGKSFTPAAWKDWTSRSSATAVPGAVAFLQEAKHKGASIFYISNRDTSELQSTLRNLELLQLPDADTAHILLMTGTSSKEARQQQVMANYNVFMLMGDNLNDFLPAFEKKSPDGRFAETEKQREEWGRKFIVLPNATYGEWENALYNYQRGLTTTEKMVLLLQQLKGYK